MNAIALMSFALLLSAVLSGIVAVREFRRGSYILAGFATVCLGFCIATLFAPIQTHAVEIDLPRNGG
jgi:pilus assembly protein TadC